MGHWRFLNLQFNVSNLSFYTKFYFITAKVE